MRSYSFLWRYLALAVALIYSQLATASWQAQNPNIFANHAAIGSSFSASGEWLFMGAANATTAGKVYIFKQNASSYKFSSELSAPESNIHADQQKFGFALASAQIAGSTWLAVSAPHWHVDIEVQDGTNKAGKQGRIYFYKLQHDSWQYVQSLDYPHADVIGPQMGRDLQFANEQLLIGVANEGDVNKPTGRLLIAAATGADADKPWQFIGASTSVNAHNYGLVAPAKWRCDNDRFAYAFAHYGQQIFVGAPQATENGCTNGAGQQVGAVYIYKQTDLSAAPVRMVSNQPLIAAQFGSAIAVNNQHLLIGAMYDRADGVGSGVVYAYKLDGAGNWQLTQKIYPQNADGKIFFGRNMALSGNKLLIGAARSAVKAYNPNTAADVENVDVGAVYYFEFSDGKWQQRQKISAPEKFVAGQFFGSVLAWLPASKTPLIASSDLHNATHNQRGNAHVYVDKHLLNIRNISFSAQGALQNQQQLTLNFAVHNPEAKPSQAQQLRISLPPQLELLQNDSQQPCAISPQTLLCPIGSIAADASLQYQLVFKVSYQQAARALLTMQIQANSKLHADSFAIQQSELLFNSIPQAAVVGSASKNIKYANARDAEQLFKLTGSDALQQKLVCKLNNYQHIFSCKQQADQFVITLEHAKYLKAQTKIELYAELSNGLSNSQAQKFTLNIEQPTNTLTPPQRDPKIGSFDFILLILLAVMAGARQARRAK